MTEIYRNYLKANMKLDASYLATLRMALDGAPELLLLLVKIIENYSQIQTERRR